MIFIPQQATYDDDPMFDPFSSIFLARVQRLRLILHMLDVLALSNFDPAQRKYVWVYRWARMEKRWQWLTGYEIRSLRRHRSPAALTVYRADVAASSSSLLLYCLLYSLPATLFGSAKPKPPPHPPSSRVHWKSASAWKWCHWEKEMKC